MINAIHEQLEEMTFGPPLQSTNVRAVELAKLLTGLMPGDLHTLKFLSGGSESTEAAVKLAKQYHKQTGNPNKYKVDLSLPGLSRVDHGLPGRLGDDEAQDSLRAVRLRATSRSSRPPATAVRYGLNYPECDVLCATIIGEGHQGGGPFDRGGDHAWSPSATPGG